MALRMLLPAALALVVTGIARGAEDAAAPKMQEMRVDGIPSVFRDAAGRVTGCGLRLFAVEELPPPRELFRTVDVSMLFGVESFTQGAALLKGSSFEATRAGIRDNRPTRSFVVTDAWVQRPGTARSSALPGRAPPPGNNPTTHAYLAETRPLLDVADAALSGKPVQVGMVREGQPPVLVGGAVTMLPRAKQEFAVCMRALTQRAQSPAQ
jgi:hypothetical protein